MTTDVDNCNSVLSVFIQNQPHKISPNHDLTTISQYCKLKSRITNVDEFISFESLHDQLVQHCYLYIIKLFTYLINLNDQNLNNQEKITKFEQFYIDIFQTLPFVSENTKNSSMVKLLFTDFYNDYNLITLSQINLKNRNHFQSDLSEYFKKREIRMERNKNFMREFLSACLNDWFSHL